jgi:hypothetical protein
MIGRQPFMGVEWQLYPVYCCGHLILWKASEFQTVKDDICRIPLTMATVVLNFGKYSAFS